MRPNFKLKWLPFSVLESQTDNAVKFYANIDSSTVTLKYLSIGEGFIPITKGTALILIKSHALKINNKISPYYF